MKLHAKLILIFIIVACLVASVALKGGIHTSCMTNPSSVSNYVLDWLNGYLRNDSSAKNVFTDGGKLANDSAWQDFRNKN